MTAGVSGDWTESKPLLGVTEALWTFGSAFWCLPREAANFLLAGTRPPAISAEWVGQADAVLMQDMKTKSGCRGCLIWLVCIIAGFLVIAGVAMYLGYLQLTTLRDRFTQSQPLKLPTVTYASAEIQSINKRVDEFLLDAREGKIAAHLSLTEREINILLSSSGYSNMVYVTVTNGSLRGQISIPIQSLTGLFNRAGITFLKGRYLIGEGTFTVAAPDGVLSVKLSDLAVNGRPLPEHYMTRIRPVNLASGVATNASTRLSLQRIRQIEAQDGMLILSVAPRRD
jgi:hypothetical protein